MKGAKKMVINQLSNLISAAVEHVRLRQGLYQVCTVSGLVGAWIIRLIGDIDGMLIWLLVAMAIDWITGCMAAAKCKSEKTENGGLSSKAGLRGIGKKLMMLMLVVFAHFGDVALGCNFWRNAFVISFIANEGLSIAENAGKYGVNLPPALANMLEVLKKKADVKE